MVLSLGARAPGLAGFAAGTADICVYTRCRFDSRFPLAGRDDTVSLCAVHKTFKEVSSSSIAHLNTFLSFPFSSVTNNINLAEAAGSKDGWDRAWYVCLPLLVISPQSMHHMMTPQEPWNYSPTHGNENILDKQQSPYRGFLFFSCMLFSIDTYMQRRRIMLFTERTHIQDRMSAAGKINHFDSRRQIMCPLAASSNRTIA